MLSKTRNQEMNNKTFIEHIADAILQVSQVGGDWSCLMNAEECAEAAIKAMQSYDFKKCVEIKPQNVTYNVTHSKYCPSCKVKNSNDVQKKYNQNGLNITTHAITGEMTKPHIRWCNACHSHVCVLDDPIERQDNKGEL